MIGTSTYEIPNGMRGIAETGLDQSRRAFGTLFAAVRRNAELMQGASEFARNSTLEMAARGVDYAEQNIHASLDYAQKLARVRDVQEAMQVQVEFMRDRFGALQGQAKEIGGLAQSTMRQGAEQAKVAVQENQQQIRKAAEQGQDAAKKTLEKTAQTASDAANATASH